MDKRSLIERLENSRNDFLDLLDEINEEDLELPGISGEWSIKDTLCHLTMWEAQMVTHLFQTQQGGNPRTVLNEGSPDDVVNARFYDACKGRALDLVLADFYAVRTQTIRRVEAFAEKDLANATRYAWTGGHPLSDYIIWAVVEHEEEHAAQIRTWAAARKPN